jgi:hypothetical protein
MKTYKQDSMMRNGKRVCLELIGRGWFLYNEMPSGCWGKQGAFSAWVERKHAEREEGKCQTT